MAKQKGDIKPPANIAPEDEPLWWLLYWYAKEAKTFWPHCRRTGLSDAELRDAIVQVLPQRKTGHLPCAMWWCYAPKDRHYNIAPAIWLNADSVGYDDPVDPSQPIIKIEGQEFLDKVRALLNMPYPGEAPKPVPLDLDALEQRGLWEL